jgi:hypothetical protein
MVALNDAWVGSTSKVGEIMLVDEIQKLMDIYAMILACMYSVLPSYHNLVNEKSLKKRPGVGLKTPLSVKSVMDYALQIKILY